MRAGNRFNPRHMANTSLPAPQSLAESGLTADLLTQLALKTLYFSGELSGGDLVRRLGLQFSVIEPVLDALKQQYYCEVVGGGILGGSSYRYRITSQGRQIATLYLQQDQYVGVAPVPLEQYKTYMASLHSGGVGRVSPADVRRALQHLVLSDKVLDEIGAAANGGHSMFIYGPPGNGKTVVAHAIRGLLTGDIAIPHAIEVEGSVVRIFDPVSHEERPVHGADSWSVDAPFDMRWALCRRPMVTAGGELSLEALELRDSKVGFYRAPLQLMANGGVLVIDDFGRQRCEPHDLLNRWMVPLESRVDFLTLRSGLKFEVPFHVFVAFATNIKPSDLVDEAFLRRVQYKVFTENPTVDQYVRIFQNYCASRQIDADRALIESLLNGYYERHAIVPRACHPRDIVNQSLLLATYRGAPQILTPELLDSACASYFVDDRPE